MNLLMEPFSMLTESLTQTLITVSPQEAYAGIILLAMTSDQYLASYLAEEELDAIDRYLRPMHLFQHFQPETMRRMCEKLFTILHRDGENVLIASARETLPPDLREAAFAAASDLIFASGMISRVKSSFLTQLSQALEIPMGTTANILSLSHLKYSYNNALGNA